MSTSYTLAKVGPVELFAAECSGRIEIGIVYDEEARPSDSDGYLDTGSVFDDEALIQIIVELAKVATYIADDDLSVVPRILAAIKADPWLGSGH